MRLHLSIIAALGIALLSGCTSQPTSHPSLTPYKHVVVIGVDGMSPDGVKKAATPVMDKLMAEGAYTMHSRSVLPTSSSTNWSSMINGAGPEQHGVTSNGWERDDHVLPPVATGPEGIFPTIFSVIREQKPNAKIGAIYHWEGFGRLYEASQADYDMHGPGEDTTAILASEYIKTHQPTFTFIHLDHVDGAGHGQGHGSDAYYKAVEKADSLIGNILEACTTAGITDDMLVIISSDHGGIGFGHGGETLAEIEIPFIMAGPRVRKGHKINHQVYQYDNASTVAFALGIEQPYGWIGKPVKSAFEGFPIPTVKKEIEFLAEPSIRPRKLGWGPGGGLFINETPEVSMSSPDEGAEIRFTTDGSKPTPSSKLYEGPFTLNKTTMIRAAAFRGDRDRSQPTSASFRIVKDTKGMGLKYTYYENDKEWEILPDFSALAPVRKGLVAEPSLLALETADGNYGIRFEGNIQIEEPGEYTFYTNSDDGSRLWIDSKPTVDNDGNHGNIERSGKRELEKGLHRIRVDYMQGHGGAFLEVLWKGPGIPKQVIPPDVLTP